MAKLIVLYGKPVDAGAFDAYYFATHAPLAKRIPGLLGYEVSDGTVQAVGDESPYHLVATLEFASMEALRAALASPEGQAAAADLANFASGGVTLLMSDTRAL